MNQYGEKIKDKKITIKRHNKQVEKTIDDDELNDFMIELSEEVSHLITGTNLAEFQEIIIKKLKKFFIDNLDIIQFADK